MMNIMTTAKTALTLAALVVGMLAPACAGVTETGNPVPLAGPATEGVAEYTNDAFGVLIRYPGDWGFEEDDDASYVLFTSPETAGEGSSTAEMFFEILDPAPVSLEAYLALLYPGRIFSVVITPALTGYLFDDPNAGPDGGDLREYYFLNNDVFVLVAAELAPATSGDFFVLLDGIEFF